MKQVVLLLVGCELCSQGFVEFFKEYKVGDFSEEEIEDEEEVVEVEELGVEYFDKFLTRDELAYHKYLLRDPSPPFSMRCPIIIGGNPLNLNISCNIGQVHVWKANMDLKSRVNIMTRMHYNWIMKRQLEPRIDSEDLRRINFLIVEDISLVIDPCLSQVVLGKPFVEVANMTYDSLLGIVKFTNEVDEVAYKMPHKIEQFRSLSNMEKEYKQSVYFRNEEDKRRGVDYEMKRYLVFIRDA
ncbi:hypothetical protein Tco_0027290 [Tanacetum coccineum]